MPKVKHFRGTWTVCVLADRHARPSSRHKSQVWREILSTNAEFCATNPCLTGTPHAGQGPVKKLSVKSAEELRKGKSQQWGRTKVILMREERRCRKEEREWIEDDEREEMLTQPHSQEASSKGS